MDLTAYSRHQLELTVNEFSTQGWRPYTGIIDQTVLVNDESGTNKISFTITLVKYED